MVVVYNTNTGEIKDPDEQYELGKYTRLHTLVGVDEESSLKDNRWTTTYHSANISMLRSGEAPPIEQLNAVMIGSDTRDSDPRIMPERINPDQPRLMGLFDSWGKDLYGLDLNGVGDTNMLATLRTFNTKNSVAS